MTQPTLTYDPDVKALYIELLEAETQAASTRE